MVIVAVLCTVGFIALRRRRSGTGMRDLIAVGLLIAAASLVPYAAITARDVVFDIEPGQLVQRHGFSDILYMGLGTVPNSFGIVYSDWVALAHAQKVDPDVVHCSPAFYQIMWNLYLEKLFTDPAEVARIYIEKARLILADPVVEPGHAPGYHPARGTLPPCRGAGLRPLVQGRVSSGRPVAGSGARLHLLFCRPGDSRLS